MEHLLVSSRTLTIDANLFFLLIPRRYCGPFDDGQNNEVPQTRAIL